MGANSKWLKWQLGAAGAVSVFILFSTVQNTAAFQAAQTAAAGGNTASGTEQQGDQQDTVDQWLSTGAGDGRSSISSDWNDGSSGSSWSDSSSESRAGSSRSESRGSVDSRSSSGSGSSSSSGSMRSQSGRS